MEQQRNYSSSGTRKLNEAADNTGYETNFCNYHPDYDRSPPGTSSPWAYTYAYSYSMSPDPYMIDNSSTRCAYPGCRAFPTCTSTIPNSSYMALDRYLSKNGHTVYKGTPQPDKEYLFLFCKLKSVPEYYEQVLNDKSAIWTWSSKSLRTIYSSTESMPESLDIAKRIVAENGLKQDITDMLNCLRDICSERAWQREFLAQKKTEEFLLEFWKKNKRKPSDSEISETFCTGWTCEDPKKVVQKVCTASTCVNPWFGKRCIGLNHYAMKLLGQDFLAWLEEGGSTEEGVMIIEDNYKKRLEKPYKCRANYIKAKLQEAQRSGVIKEIEQQNQAFKDLMIPGLDSDEVESDTSVGVPV